MAKNDQEQYEQALRKWDNLRTNEALSVPAEVGIVAVVLAYDHARDANPLTTDHYASFVSEANRLAQRLQSQGKRTEVASDINHADFKQILTDPTFSDIIMIGNGCLSALNLTAPETRLGWRHVSRMTDHLKTGLFIQRSCGILPRKMNVPLGLMAVANHNQVHAPVNRSITPRSLNDRSNRFIQPVTDKERLSFEELNALLPQSSLPLSQQLPLKVRGLVRRVAVGEFGKL